MTELERLKHKADEMVAGHFPESAVTPYQVLCLLQETLGYLEYKEARETESGEPTSA